MISVRQALDTTLKFSHPLKTEKIPLNDALGAVLGQDAVSDIDMPPFKKSMMDGFAVRAEDCREPNTGLKVVGIIPAGITPDFKIRKGEAAKIMTGAPLPAGADSVQMIEKTQYDDDDKVLIVEPVNLGKHVSQEGEILKKGQLTVPKGTMITPPVLGALATVGISEPVIHTRPQVAILVTGDELVELERKPGPGQIRNSNGYVLSNQVREINANPVFLGIVGDDIKILSGKIAEGLNSHALLISGGVSMGDYDLVEEVLLKQGITIHYDKLNIKPGKPTVFGSLGDKIIFGLPGNPVSASTIFDVLVKPALKKMMGFSNYKNTLVQSTLIGTFKSNTKRECYHPAHTFFKADTFYTEPIVSKGSADVLAYSRCNSYLVVESETESLQDGKPCSMLPRTGFWENMKSE